MSTTDPNTVQIRAVDVGDGWTERLAVTTHDNGFTVHCSRTHPNRNLQSAAPLELNDVDALALAATLLAGLQRR